MAGKETFPIDSAKSGDTIVLEDSDDWYIWGVIGKGLPEGEPTPRCPIEQILKDGKTEGTGKYIGWVWDCSQCKDGKGDGGIINLRVEEKNLSE